MRLLFKILFFIITIAVLAFLILWCVSSLKGMSFGEYLKSLFATAEPAIAVASTTFRAYSGGGLNV